MVKTTKKKFYKGDDLTKTARDRKRGGSKYEPWEKKSKKNKKKTSRPR
jgi:hypothetical protein